MSSIVRDKVPEQIGTYLLLDPSDCQNKTDDDGTCSQPVDTLGCIALLLANHISHCDSTGYDARTRSVIKLASVHVLAKEMEVRKQPLQLKTNEIIEFKNDQRGQPSEEKLEPTLSDMLEDKFEEIQTSLEDEASQLDESKHIATKRKRTMHFLATRKFQEVEQTVAQKLLHLLVATALNDEKVNIEGGKPKTSSNHRSSTLRYIQIGGAAIAAGTLLAVTGGMAAPGIAAGFAALGIGSAALTTLTSTAMLATLFGIGGGGLTAYKMKRRTDGLSEFRIRREGVTDSSCGTESSTIATMSQRQPGLRSTVCISGWLCDEYDFQRPWGITPTDPELADKLELLKRFYSVHDPERLFDAENILQKWQGREDHLWEVLEGTYGRDPTHLLPIKYDSLQEIPLTMDEDEKVGNILGTLFVNRDSADGKRDKKTWVQSVSKKEQMEAVSTFLKQNSTRHICVENSSNSCDRGDGDLQDSPPISYRMKRFDDNVQPSSAWDFLSLYGGELYTITWESTQLLEICKYVKAMARQVASTASKEVLKQTALATIMSAVAFPSAVMKLADMIDEPWSLITMRADEAGVELANCLLQSEEHKPITLIGYSFGGRIVYSCLKELARHQEIWENQQESSSDEPGSSVRVSAAGADVEKDDIIKYSREPATIVEDAILMGTPKFVDKESWVQFRRIVAGRLVNCYSTKDWVLSLIFQAKNMTGVFRDTCGTSAISGVRGVENFDLSELITSHGHYCIMVQQALRVIGYGEPRIMMD